MIRPLAVLLAAGLPVAAFAQPPELGLPIDCRPGVDCWLLHTFDRDPGPGALDSFCGPLTYDGHDGVDFGLADLEAMARGVRVLAAAPGTVRAVRDGMADVPIERVGGETAVDGKECGNGVFVDHADGWSTQYCHLRKGSIAVAAGDEVERGSPLGLVGNSGLASFPHVHVTLREGERKVDPFLPHTEERACSTEPVQGHWSAEAAAAMAYAPAALVSIGMGDGPTDMEAVLDGSADDRPLTGHARRPWSSTSWATGFARATGSRWACSTRAVRSRSAGTPCRSATRRAR